jgi:thiamine transport system substrate-binding protein
MLAGSDNKGLAREFLRFMVSEEFQQIIPTTNWMFPAALAKSKLPPEFSQLVDPSPALLFDDEEVMKRRRAWIDEWLEVMSR